MVAGNPLKSWPSGAIFIVVDIDQADTVDRVGLLPHGALSPQPGLQLGPLVLGMNSLTASMTRPVLFKSAMAAPTPPCRNQSAVGECRTSFALRSTLGRVPDKTRTCWQPGLAVMDAVVVATASRHPQTCCDGCR
jgi:hypothetical protein